MGCLDSRLSLQGLADNARSRREASVILPFQTQKYQRRISQTMSSVKRKWIARKSGTAECLRKLRQLSLEQFEELMISLPRTDYASLSSVLPGWHLPKCRGRGSGRTEQIFWRLCPDGFGKLRLDIGLVAFVSAFLILVVVMGAFCARCCILAILLICTDVIPGTARSTYASRMG